MVKPDIAGIARGIERVQELDQISKPVRQAVINVVPNGSTAKDLLSGTWLGHPLHPVLTDVVIGSWTSAFLLDLLRGKHGRKAADRLLGIGILAAVPTVSAGLSDWADVRGGAQRVGIVHAMGNTTALVLNTLSWLARKRGKRIRGRLLSMLGMGVAVGSAYLGGYLSFTKGVGVNQTAFEELPEDWQPLIDLEALPEGKLAGAEVNGIGIVLYRHDGRIDALADRCSHRGCPLHRGSVNDDSSVTCPCHGSTFRLTDGMVLKGPATAPQPAFDTRVREGKVEVRVRSS